MQRQAGIQQIHVHSDTLTYANGGKNTQCCYEGTAKDAVSVNHRHGRDNVHYVTTSASTRVCIYSSRILCSKNTSRERKNVFVSVSWMIFLFLHETREMEMQPQTPQRFSSSTPSNLHFTPHNPPKPHLPLWYTPPFNTLPPNQSSPANDKRGR